MAENYPKITSFKTADAFRAHLKALKLDLEIDDAILPAPESAHAIRAAIDEALRCKESGEKKTILFGLTGTGFFDMAAYTRFNEGTMSDYIPSDEELQRSFDTLPKVPGLKD